MLQRTNSLNAVNRIVTTTLNNAGRIANEIKDTKIDVEEQSLKQNQIKGVHPQENPSTLTSENSGVLSSVIQKSDKTLNQRKKELEQKSKTKGLTEQEQKELSDIIKFFKNKQQSKKKLQKQNVLKRFYKNLATQNMPDFVKNYFNIHNSLTVTETTISQLNEEFSKIVTNLKKLNDKNGKKFEDYDKWNVFFQKHYNSINENIGLEDKFEKKLTLFFQLTQLSNLFKVKDNTENEKDKYKNIIENNRFYFFNEDIATETLNVCQNDPQVFLSTYKSNLTKELLKNCEKFEIKDDNGTPVGIAYNIEKLNDDTEHDNLQIRRLQNLAAPTWCTCRASNCKNYLSNANSFLFIPNEGERILRIQGLVNGDNISINSVTSLENEHNDNDGCWISEQDDLTHLWAFISTMEQNGYNIKAKNSIFNMEEIVSLEEKNRIENRYPSVASLLNKIKNANDINEIMQILNNSEYIKIQNGSLKIRNCSTEERNNLIEALYSTSFFSELNINRIPYSINFKDQEQIDLNTITDHSRIMRLTNVHYFNCLNLKELKGSIQQTSTSNIPIVVNVPNLTNAKSIWLSNIENINLPNLIECDFLTLGNQDQITNNTPTLPDITLEKLEKVNEEFSVLNPQKLNLPSIKYINNFKIEIDKEDNFNNFDFIVPNLERIDNLEIRVGYNQNVQEIVKKLSSIIKLAKNTTVIIKDYKTYNQEQIAELAKKAEVE